MISIVEEKNMERIIHTRRGYLFGAVVVSTVLGFGFLIGLLASPPSENSLQSATATPMPEEWLPNPIETESEAISRTLSWFSTSITVPSEATTAAKLISTATFHQLGGAVGDKDVDTAPVWLVGVYGEGYKLGDVLSLASAEIKDDPVDGFYMAWDANSGEPLQTGPMADQWSINVTSLSQLSNEEIVIQMATAVIEPTEEPVPTETPES